MDFDGDKISPLNSFKTLNHTSAWGKVEVCVLWEAPQLLMVVLKEELMLMLILHYIAFVT